MLKMRAIALARKRIELALRRSITEPPVGDTFRRAVRDDFQDFKELSPNAFGGTDFMQGKFEQYVLDPKRYLHVAVKSDKVIACIYLYLIDGGSTFYAGGARRHPTYRGLAVGKALQDHAFVDTLAANPSVRQMRIATFGRESAARFHPTFELIRRSERMNITMAKSVPRCKIEVITSSEFATHFSTQLGVDKTEIRFARDEDLKEIFTNPSLVERVFPWCLIYGGLDLFEPRVVNLSALFQEERKITVSKECLSVVVCEYYRAQCGIIFDMTLHGEASAEIAMAHILRLAEHFIDICPAPEPMSIIIHIPPTILKGDLLSLCKNLPFYQEEDVFNLPDLVAHEVEIPQVKAHSE